MSEQTNLPLPPTWFRTTIGVVIEDKVPQSGPSGNDTFIYVDIGGIDNSTKRIVDPKLLQVTEAPSRAKQLLAADDVLVSMTRPNLNAVAKVPAELDGAIGSTGFDVLRTKIIEPSWLYYTVQSNDFVHAMCQVVQGALYPAVRPRDIRSYGLPIPPLNEQRRIVAKIEELFSDLDAGVAALERAKANLKRYRAAVLKAAVEGKLTEAWRAEHPNTEPASKLLERILAERRQKWEADQLAKFAAAKKEPPKNWKEKYVEPTPPDTTDLPELPKGWCWASIEQIAAQESYSLAIGPFGSNLKVSDYRDEGVPLIFVRNIRSTSFGDDGTKYVSQAKAEELDAHSVTSGDILVTKMGDPPGDACLYPTGQPKAIITADCIKVRLHPFLNAPLYFVHCINSRIVRSQVIAITKGVAQQKVSLGRFSEVAVPVAPLEEQEEIVALIGEKTSQSDVSEIIIDHGLRRANRLRQSILKQAFEGKLVPQDPTDEPASVLLERLRAKQAIHEGNGKADTPARTRGRRGKSKITEGRADE